MYVLFVVLNQPEHLGEIVRKLKDVGIHSATIIDSVGTAQLRSSMGKEIPFIGSLMRSLDEVGDNNKTMFTVVDSKKQAIKIMDEIEKICGGDMSKPGTGIMFTIPIDMVRGGSISRKGLDQMYKAE
ncbi:MAG TPA: hypothetical protein VEG39_11690 [Clostridia bacterium]|nr:hypothetical protein [Clostridia bacterium]